MFGRHHRLGGNEFEQTLGDSEGQERLVCCSPWGPKEWSMTQRLNNSIKNIYMYMCMCVCVCSAWHTRLYKHCLKKKIVWGVQGLPWCPVAKTPHSQCRGPDSITSQGTRSYMLQPLISLCMLKLKILQSTTKSWYSKMNSLKQQQQQQNLAVICDFLSI